MLENIEQPMMGQEENTLSNKLNDYKKKREEKQLKRIVGTGNPRSSMITLGLQGDNNNEEKGLW